MRALARTAAFLARWRLELATILAILAAHHALTRVIPDPWTTILILAAITGLVSWPRSRAVVTTGLWHARVRRAWTRAVIDTGAADPPPGRSRRPASLHGPKARRIKDVLAGEQLAVRIPRGDSVTTLEQHADALAACLQVTEVRITRDPANARYCRALLIRRDPFADPTPIPWPNQHADTLSLWDPIPIGIDENGDPVTINSPTSGGLLDTSGILIGGAPGYGKSTAQAVIAATGALDPDCRLWLFDGKRLDLPPWAPCAHRLVRGPDRNLALKYLRELRDVMDERLVDLEATGDRRITRRHAWPVHLLIMDELAVFLLSDDPKDKKTTAAITEVLRDIVARGRAAGVIACLATQSPDAETIDTRIRRNITYRHAVRTMDWQGSDMILGTGWAPQGYDASRILTRGVAYFISEGARPERVKGYLLDDEGVSQIASRATGRHAEAWLAGTGRPATDTGLEQSDGTGGNTAPEQPASSPEPEDAG
jgi:hypothetical protein